MADDERWRLRSVWTEPVIHETKYAVAVNVSAMYRWDGFELLSRAIAPSAAPELLRKLEFAAFQIVRRLFGKTDLSRARASALLKPKVLEFGGDGHYDDATIAGVRDVQFAGLSLGDADCVPGKTPRQSGVAACCCWPAAPRLALPLLKSACPRTTWAACVSVSAVNC